VPVEKASGGSLAWAADGGVLLWSPNLGEGVYRSADRGGTWTKSKGPDFRARVVADAVNPLRFYFYHPPTGEIWASKDGGVSFAVVNQVAPRGGNILRTVPGREGHFWLPLNGGGLHFSRNGSNLTKVEDVDVCNAVGLGKAAPGSLYDTLFIWGRPKGEKAVGVYRSTDAGRSWLRVNDDAHEFGGLANGQFVVGDRNVFGRVYLSTAGRGIVFGEPAR
jgi:photosystem II stability/assembly factor-like uncharacterized protein